MILAELGVGDFEGAEEVGFRGIEISASLVEEAEVVGHRRDVEHERWLVFFEELVSHVPLFARLVLAAESVIGGTESGMQAADESELVRAVFELVDGLAVVIAGEFEVSELAV